MADGVPLRSVSVLLLLAAPPCQETNPDFDGAEGTGAGVTIGAPDTGVDGGMSTVAATGDSTAASAEGDGFTTSATATATATTSGTSDADGTSTSAGSTTTGGDTGPATTTGDGCPDPMQICAGECVDLMTDHDNCGNCNNSCHPVQEVCVMAECVPD